MPQVIVIGAGVGGLTTAAILAKAGLPVTLLESHIYPGGCAGTFYHQKYRFDAGATLAGGFYPGGPMDLVAHATGLKDWSTHPGNPAMVVHLPDGRQITRWADERRWSARRQAFGPAGEFFWRWQEKAADALWQFALRNPAWPPQTGREAVNLIQQGTGWAIKNGSAIPGLMADAFQPVAAHLKGVPENLRLFVDGQLLIAAQTTSRYTNALYGASALDLPRRGVVHLQGGMGTIAHKLADTFQQNGGKLHYRQVVKRIVMGAKGPVAVETNRHKSFPADIVIANLPPWNIVTLLGDERPPALQNLPPQPQDGWGAFTVYVGLDTAAVPDDFPLHHQLINREPLAEGNTLFLSLSPAWDVERAPEGMRALTISTHTNLADWWQLFEHDPAAYQARKAAYTAQILTDAERVIPDLRQAANLILPGTPVTFQRFTRRAWGWVGGFPQTSLFRAWGPRLGKNLWMVGDSIFPGQSTAAVALGGMRVAKAIITSI